MIELLKPISIYSLCNYLIKHLYRNTSILTEFEFKFINLSTRDVIYLNSKRAQQLLKPTYECNGQRKNHPYTTHSGCLHKREHWYLRRP